MRSETVQTGAWSSLVFVIDDDREDGREYSAIIKVTPTSAKVLRMSPPLREYDRECEQRGVKDALWPFVSAAIDEFEAGVSLGQNA
jgi:hypothetical protein